MDEALWLVSFGCWMTFTFEILLGDALTGEVLCSLRSKSLSLDTPGIDILSRWLDTYKNGVKDDKELFLLISNKKNPLPIQPTLF